jgi:hypothetical protein
MAVVLGVTLAADIWPTSPSCARPGVLGRVASYLTVSQLVARPGQRAGTARYSFTPRIPS